MALQFIPDLQRLAVKLTAALEKQSEIGITASEITVLARLCDVEALEIAVLYREVGIAPSTLSSILGRLQRRQLILRRPRPSDRRSYEIALTEEGREKARLSKQFLENLEAQMIERLSYGHMMAFSEVVETIEQTLENPRPKAMSAGV